MHFVSFDKYEMCWNIWLCVIGTYYAIYMKEARITFNILIYVNTDGCYIFSKFLFQTKTRVKNTCLPNQHFRRFLTKQDWKLKTKREVSVRQAGHAMNSFFVLAFSILPFRISSLPYRCLLHAAEHTSHLLRKWLNTSRQAQIMNVMFRHIKRIHFRLNLFRIITRRRPQERTRGMREVRDVTEASCCSQSVLRGRWRSEDKNLSLTFCMNLWTSHSVNKMRMGVKWMLKMSITEVIFSAFSFCFMAYRNAMNPVAQNIKNVYKTEVECVRLWRKK